MPWKMIGGRSKDPCAPRRGTRVLVDRSGRIVKGGPPKWELGGPPKWEGIHYKDVYLFERMLADIQREKDEAIAFAEKEKPPKRSFRTKKQGYDELLEANPHLAEYIEYNDGATDFTGWVRGGRLGPKPVPNYPSGEFDWVNEYFGLSGRNEVFTYREALYRVLPNSKRYDEIDMGALRNLGEQVGAAISPPPETWAYEGWENRFKAIGDRAYKLSEDLEKVARSSRLEPEPRRKARIEIAEETNDDDDGWF